MRRLVIATLVLGWSVVGFTQQDPNEAWHNEVITVPLGNGRSIAAIITHAPNVTKFKHAFAMFPGSPGYGNFRMENGKVRIDGLGGNFLIRARRHFTGDDAIVVVLDAPSDQQGSFSQSFRETDRYGEDVKAVLDAINKRFAGLEWTFIGTSEGTVSAAQAGRMLSSQIKRVVLTSSLVESSGRGRGLAIADIQKITTPLLWVQHKNDPCKFTPYWKVKRYSEETHTPLVTVTGSKGSSGDPCEARSEHGFIGVEILTIKAILSWIYTGNVPPDVSG